MKKYVRKNITIEENKLDIINDYINKNNLSFSQFISDVSISYITNQENLDLLNFMNSNVSYIDDAEQKEIDALNIDYSDTNGKELSINEFLQD